jgi:hypothetical protein
MTCDGVTYFEGEVCRTAQARSWRLPGVSTSGTHFDVVCPRTKPWPSATPNGDWIVVIESDMDIVNLDGGSGRCYEGAVSVPLENWEGLVFWK